MTIEECKSSKHPHNNRCRYTHGFYCEDCKTFFPAESEDYIRTEYISSLYLAVWNTRAKLLSEGRQEPNIFDNMLARIEAVRDHPYDMSFDDLKKFIAEIKAVVNEHGEFSEDLYRIVLR